MTRKIYCVITAMVTLKKKKTKRKTTKKRKKRRNAILCHGLRIVLSFQLLFTLHRTAPEGSSARANAQGPLRVSRGAELKEAGRGKKKNKLRQQQTHRIYSSQGALQHPLLTHCKTALPSR